MKPLSVSYRDKCSVLQRLRNRKVNEKHLLARFQPFTGHEGPQGEYSYSSTLFQTSTLEGGEGSGSRTCSTLPPGKTRYLLYRRLGKAPFNCSTLFQSEKISFIRLNDCTFICLILLRYFSFICPVGLILIHYLLQYVPKEFYIVRLYHSVQNFGHLCSNGCVIFMMMMMMIYLLTAIGLTPGGSSTVHIYTQTIHRKTE